MLLSNYSLVIRQKGESQNGCFEKTKQAKFSEKRTSLTPWYAHVRVRIRGLEMFVIRKIWLALFSWNTRFEICPFALLLTIFFLAVDKVASASNILRLFQIWVSKAQIIFRICLITNSVPFTYFNAALNWLSIL